MARLSVLLALWLTILAAPALAQPCTTSWANPVSGAWTTATNWSAGVPDETDHACIIVDGTYTVTVSGFHVGQLTLGRFSGGKQTLLNTGDLGTGGISLDNPSTIRPTGDFEWQGGYITSGTLTNGGRIRLTGPGLYRGVLNAGTVLRNEGTVTQAGTGLFADYFGALVENAGLWNFTANGYIAGSGGTTGTFINETTGTIRKSSGLGTSEIAGITFMNSGTLDVRNGKLQVSDTSIHTEAVLQASVGATLLFIGSHTFVGVQSGAIEGAFELSSDFAAGAGAAWAFTGSGIEWQGGHLVAGTLTNTGLVHLTGAFGPGVTGEDVVFRNEGTVEFAGTGALTLSEGARVENASLWEFTEAGQLAATTGALCVFANEAGATLRTSNAGTAHIDGSSLRFENAGMVDVASGTLEITSPFDHQSGASVAGDGTLGVAGSAVTHDGNTAPGAAGAAGRLTWQGDYAPSTTATLFAQIAGTTPATEYDQLAVTGDAALSGTLHVTLLGGYETTPGASFRVLTCTGTCSGTFDTVVLPSGLNAHLVYSTQSVDLVDSDPTYTVTAPAVGTRILAGTKTIVQWTGPGVPTSAVMADVYLVAPGGATTFLGSVKNIGKLKVTVPADTPTGSGYAFRVQLQSDPNVFGLSEGVAVYSPADQYTFAEPDANETWQRGTPHTVLWTAPPGAPVGGTVTLTLLRRNNSVVTSLSGLPDNGSFTATTATGLAAGEFYFTVESDTDRAYFGSSPLFGIGRIQLTAPAEGATWAAGSSQAISWTTNGVNIAGNVRQLSLRSVDLSYSKPVAINVPYADGTKTFTVPADAPAGEYYAQLLYQITSGAGVLLEIVVKSSPFTVTNPVTVPAPPVASRYFGSPEASADARETLLVVRGLTEGAEVGVYAGETLLAAGVVESGDALIAVPSEVTLEGDDWYFGETASLTLRVFDGGAESAVEARSVTLGSDGSALDGVRLASGDVVVVDASKGGAVGEASAAVFAVASVSPNPASSSATVRFQSPSSVSATVVVYDLLGRAVQTAFSGEAVEGLNEVTLQTSALPAGVYVVRVTAGAESATTRFTVVR